MQPNNQQGYWQPDDASVPPSPPASPVASIPATPPQPTAAPAPATPVAPAPQAAPAPAVPPAPVSVPSPVEDAPAPTTALPPEDVQDDDEQFDDTIPVEPISWQAQEFVHQEKNTMWFVLFGLVMAALMGVAILLMRAPTFALVLVAITVVVIVYAKRPPRMMSYSLSDKGLYIGDTLHHFADFKSFGVVHDGNEFSVMLIPIKRFQPGISVYFPEESGEDIVDMLGSRLPMRELRLDVIDHMARILRL